MRAPNEFLGCEGNPPSRFAFREAWASIGVGAHAISGVGTCTGNEDGTERERDDPAVIAHGRASS